MSLMPQSDASTVAPRADPMVWLSSGAMAEPKASASVHRSAARNAAALAWMFAKRARGRPTGFLLRKTADLAARYFRAATSTVGVNPYASPYRRGDELRGGLLTEAATVSSTLKRFAASGAPEVTHVMAVADGAVSGRFMVLSNTTSPDGETWDCDFVSGARWPVRFHSLYAYSDLLDLARPSDVKVPWELARLQALPVLALAFVFTGDERYAGACSARFSSWDRACPVGFGINWTVGMEVAMRAISLILTSEFLAGSTGAGNFVTSRLVESLGEHGRFLYRNIEYSDINGNHYVSCLLGLLYLGLALPKHDEAAKWRETAVAGLKREIVAESYADGVCHEGSIPYHRLVVEIFAHAALLCRRAGIELGQPFHDRLQRMFEFIAGYTKPSGEAPVWGDADDGRVHSFGAQKLNDHRYLLALGAKLYGRSDLGASAGPSRLDSELLLDHNLQNRTAPAVDAATVRAPVAFREGGFFVLRSGDGYAMVDCGDVGMRGRGGHGHHDTLALELTLRGVDVLTDSGCSSYTRDLQERRRMISVGAHNVGTLDHREPAPLADQRLTHAGSYRFELRGWDPDALMVRAAHFGFGAEAPYEREIQLDPSGGACTIRDSFNAPGRHDASWMFHFAEGWSAPRLERSKAVVARAGWIAELSWDAEIDSKVVQTAVYPAYGLRHERWAVQCTADFTNTLTRGFRIELREELSA